MAYVQRRKKKTTDGLYNMPVLIQFVYSIKNGIET